MFKILKNIIQGLLKKFNLQINYANNSRPRYIKAINSLGINLVFDIGANSGQFASSVLEHGFKGKIISFEPTSSAYELLCKNSKSFQNWIVHERTAIGDRCGSIKINIAGNEAASSSILEMGNTHKQNAPASIYIGSEDTRLITFDSIFNNYFTSDNKCLLKIDVQGYEDKVLDGAFKSLQNIIAVKLECSTVSLYHGDKTFEYYFSYFDELGYKLFDIDTGFSNPNTGQLLQFDALFLRS